MTKCFSRYTALIYKEIKSLSQTLIFESLYLWNQMMLFHNLDFMV